MMVFPCRSRTELPGCLVKEGIQKAVLPEAVHRSQAVKSERLRFFCRHSGKWGDFYGSELGKSIAAVSLMKTEEELLS